MTASGPVTNPKTATDALCPHCHGTGAASGAYYLHDLPCCEPCGGSGLEADILPSAEQLHPDTEALIEAFCGALKRKALDAQTKYGFSNNWKTDDWLDDLRTQVREHVEKGDPRDVALYSAFAWSRGWRLSPSTCEGDGWTLPLTKE